MTTITQRQANAGALAERGALTLDTIAAATNRTPAEVMLIAAMVDKSCPPEELLLYIARADAMKLSPLLKQCYLIPRAGKWQLQPAIDGYRIQAARSQHYTGSDDPIFRGALEVKTSQGSITVPEQATVTVWRSDGVRKNAFTSTVFWSEYYPGPGNDGNVWRQRPRGQLAKCAEALSLRKAFPVELGGWDLPADEESGYEVSPAPAPALDAATYDEIHADEEDEPKQETVTVKSPLSQRLAELIEEAARLEVPFDDCRVQYPTTADEVIRKGSRLKDRIAAKKQQLAGAGNEQQETLV